MRSPKNSLIPVLLILLSFVSFLFVKNFLLAVRIKDGTGTLWIDYAGFTFILISIFFLSKSLALTLSFFFLINIFNSIMLFSNRIYYRYFGDYITLDIFTLAPNIPFTWRNIVELIKLKDTLVFVDIPFLCLISIVSIKKMKFSIKRSQLLSLLLFLTGLSLAGLNLFILHKALPNVLTFRYGTSMLFNSMSVHNFYLLNLFEEGIKKEKLNFSAPVLPSNIVLNDPEPDPKFKIKGKLWNIIIVEFESLGAEIIGKKVNGKEITPTLNMLSRKGIYFNNFYSQALTCSGTLDVELSTLSSFYPSPRSPYAIKYANKIPFTLPRFLKEYRYNSMFFHANRGDFYRRATIMKIFGFDKLYFSDYFNSDERKYKGTDDYPFFLECAEVIKKSPQPFFAYIVTLSSHTPFDLPRGEKPELEINNIPVDETTAKYYQILNYVDRAFRAFLEELSKESIIENTILILFGDHNRKIPEENEGEIGIIKETIANKVPFIILFPGVKGKVIEKPASHVDISPTILSILGLKTNQILLGRNLLSNKNDDFAIINRNPVILIKKENVFWGYLDKGFTNCLSQCTEKELQESAKYIEILKYSEFVLKK